MAEITLSKVGTACSVSYEHHWSPLTSHCECAHWLNQSCSRPISTPPPTSSGSPHFLNSTQQIKRDLMRCVEPTHILQRKNKTKQAKALKVKYLLFCFHTGGKTHNLVFAMAPVATSLFPLTTMCLFKILNKIGR